VGVKRVAGRGPEQRKPNKAVLCPLIIIILISYIIINYYSIINYGEPSQLKPEMELAIFVDKSIKEFSTKTILLKNFYKFVVNTKFVYN
jgi:hypothetical protein